VEAPNPAESTSTVDITDIMRPSTPKETSMKITELFDVTGKTAVVTGGSRGIGAMIAHGLVANGVHVIITARKADACDEMARELAPIGRCTSIPGDLSSSSGIQEFVTRLSDEVDGLDILVNNAGATWGAPLEEFPESGFDKVLDINLKAPFLLTQALVPFLEKRAHSADPARVIMIGSVDGIRVPATPSWSYSASKAGVHMLTRHLARTLLARNITVNAIAPGPFESHARVWRAACRWGASAPLKTWLAPPCSWSAVPVPISPVP
jgi:NAD(P)-dependent dehydrogenase (short-subunit alcohol dehydrogenase family)